MVYYKFEEQTSKSEVNVFIEQSKLSKQVESHHNKT